jgi:hydrogenase maturation protein HypF
LKYRKMPGGDKVVREPWRMVLGILGKNGIPFVRNGRDRSVHDDPRIILEMIAKNINCPLTSSAGRLFDAAAALLGIAKVASYEAEGPIKLERMCGERIKDKYAFSIEKQGDCYIINTDDLFRGMAKDLKAGKNKKVIATKFHNSMAEIILRTVKKISQLTNIRDVALSGGVFQNAFLTSRAALRLSENDFKVFINKANQVNDLNIALGQYYVSGNACKG